MGAPWSDERIAEMIRLRNQGLPASKIGALIGMTRNAVIGKCHRMKLGLDPAEVARRRGRHTTGQFKVDAYKECPLHPIPPPVTYKLPIVPVGIGGVGYFDIKDGQCRFCYGDPRDLDNSFRFCGAAVTRPGSSWCEDCEAIVFPPSEQRRAKNTRAFVGRAA